MTRNRTYPKARFDNKEEDWKQKGKCRVEGVDPNRFFLSEWEEAACGFCQGCQVIVECLAYAMDNRIEEGVWGGKRPKDRARMRRRG